jgi:hypothetical protein
MMNEAIVTCSPRVNGLVCEERTQDSGVELRPQRVVTLFT